LVSIIIVNYNSGALLRACLESLRNFVTVPFEVVVVDNKSSDGSLENLPAFPELKIVRAKDNLGFSKGCNLGAAEASGSYFHFLNPDTEVTHNINECYKTAFAETTPAIYVTRLIDTTNKSERSSHPIPTLKNVYNLLVAPERVDKWYLGASVLLSKKLFEHLGRWSSEYFMYAEDTDLFYKALLAGVPTIQTPTIVIHHQGGSSRQVWNDRQRLERIEKSAFIFARKFGLVFDYFVFKHVAYCKIVWKKPLWATIGLLVFWKAFFQAPFASVSLTENSPAFKRP
jgi:GT2 family glycosyltransferase